MLPRPDGCRQSTVELLKQESRWVFENPCECDTPGTSLSDHHEGPLLCIPRLQLAGPGPAGRPEPLAPFCGPIKDLTVRALGSILSGERTLNRGLSPHFPTPVCPDARVWGGEGVLVFIPGLLHDLRGQSAWLVVFYSQRMGLGVGDPLALSYPGLSWGKRSSVCLSTSI